MVLGGLGVFILAYQLVQKNNALINRNIFILSICAALVSLIGFISVVYNDTNDYTYVTYIISMWVWLSAAYVAITCIRWVHGTISVFIVCNYLIVLGVSQCTLALGMEFYTP